MAEAQTFGKFIYIEPNDITQDKPDNAIPYPYEDYCISVDLEVKMQTRVSTGPDDGKILTFSSDNGTISFFGGSGNEDKSSDLKQGYLTTNWTDLSSDNAAYGNKECLGIESIRISYDSWYFPVVSIKFVDVRGASLMMPQERAFQTQTAAGDRDITHLESGSFFKSLFTFPYPEFKLKVKGFYGKQVTYRLTVSRQEMSFNAQTGNFECNVDFVGYMYGVYTDIPMAYIALAPYIDNKAYWTRNADRFVFKDNNGNTQCQMPTFPELRKNITEALIKAAQEASTSEVGKGLKNSNETKDKIQELLFNFNDAVSRDYGWHCLEDNNNSGDVYTYYFMKDDVDIAKNGGKMAEFMGVLSTYNTEHKEYGLLESVKDIEKLIVYKNPSLTSDTSNAIFQPEFCIEAVNDGWELKNCKYVNGGLSSNNIFGNDWNKNILEEGWEIPKNDTPSPLLQKSPLEEKLNQLFKQFPELQEYCKGKKRIYFATFDSNFVKKTTKIIEDCNVEIEKKTTELEDTKLVQIENILGYSLTIENVFRLVFAHIETFMHHFFTMRQNVLKTIEGKTGKRSINKFGGYDFLDISPNWKGEVPPFPLCVKESKENGSKQRVVQYPFNDATSEGEKMDEQKFVEALINAGRAYDAGNEEVNKILAQAMANQNDANFTNMSDYGTIPTTLRDFANTSAIKNPYTQVLKAENATDFAGRTITAFFLRAFYFFSTIKKIGKDKGAAFFGSAEAINFAKAVKTNLTPQYKEFLINKYDKNINDGLNYLTTNGDKVWKFGDDTPSPLRSDGAKCFYQWIKNIDNDYILPIADYDIDSIKKDLAEGIEDNKNLKYIAIKNNYVSSETNFNDNLNVITYNNQDYWNTILESIKKDENSDKIKNLDDFFADIAKGKLNGQNPYQLKHFLNNVDNIFIAYDNTDFGDESSKPRKVKYKDAIDCDILTLSSGKNPNPKTYIESIATGGWEKSMDLLTPFCRPIFYHQNGGNAEDILYRKAYIFVFSIPVASDYHNLCSTTENEPVIKSEILRIGAYFWRKNIMEGGNEDPIKYGGAYGHPKYNQIPSKTKYGVLFYDGSDNYEYMDERTNNISSAKQNLYVDYFKDWAKNEFKDICKAFECTDIKPSEDTPTSKTYDINDATKKAFCNASNQRLLTNLYKQEIMPINCAGIMTNSKESNELSAPNNLLLDAFRAFIDTLKALYEDDSNLNTDDTKQIQEAIETNVYQDKDVRLSTYLNLKNINDKWLCGKNEEIWVLDGEKSDFRNFQFMDCYYNNIGQRFRCNAAQIRDMLGKVLPTEALVSSAREVGATYQGMSVYEFLADIAQKNQMVLLAQPIMSGLNVKGRGINSVTDMFRPHTYAETQSYEEEGETFICLYNYKPSSYLDIRDDNGLYCFGDDGYDIADINGRKSPLLPSTLEELEGEDVIPAFGVTYAKQNQSMFKNITLSTKDQQVTEQSIATTQMIASRGADSAQEAAMPGQDLYRVYANYAYGCTVECMGNAQIMPMMYFQLNNIPMWRGAYMITKVEHTIVAGNMTTVFTGVRQSKNSIPFVNGAVITIRDDNSVVYGSSYTPDKTNAEDDVRNKSAYEKDYSINPNNANTTSGECSPTLETWLECVATMGEWYQYNIHTYQGNRGARQAYPCSLFADNTTVMDDCSSFVTACVGYFAYKTGRSNWKEIMSKWPWSTASLVGPDCVASKYLKELGFTYRALDGSTMNNRTNTAVRKGDIVNYRSNSGGHTEIVWKTDGSWMSQAWGNVHDNLDDSTGKGMPCWYAKDPYTHSWRFSG